MKYRAVFFDVGGTLMRMDREHVAQKYVALARARHITIDPEIALRTFSTLDDEIPARARAAPPLSLDERAGEIFWKALFADGWSRLGLEKNDEAINQLYHDFRRGDFNRLFDDVLPALAALQKRNLTMGVVTNFTANCQDVLHTLGVAKYFPNGHIIVSAIVGAEKPARKIFDYATRSVKYPGNEIVYVGDGVHSDVEGAHGAGWDAILLDRDNWYPDYNTVPRIRSLIELANLI